VNNLPFKTGHLFLGVAVILGIITMMLFMNSGKPAKKEAAAPQKISTQLVVVPTSPIIRGDVLSFDNVKAVSWPSDFLPKGATFNDPSLIVGRVSTQDLFPGEPIFAQKLASAENTGLPAMIPHGKRAVTVAVSEVIGVAGFIKPGDHIDVLGTFSYNVKGSDGDSLKRKRTVTVLQNVEVLASAQTMTEDKNVNMETPPGVVNGEVKQVKEEDKDSKKDKKKEKEKSEKELEKERKDAEKEAEKDRAEAESRAKTVSSITLALTPEQTQIITLAEESGDLRMVLRPNDDQNINAVAATLDQEIMFPNQKRASAPLPRSATPVLKTPPAPAKFKFSGGFGNSVEMIEGTNKSSISF